MVYDYKKEFKALYAPATTPTIIDVPPMQFLAVRGQGDPNEEDGAYSRAVQLLYSTSYTLKMSHRGPYKMDGFFEYVVPPLEGFWWQDQLHGVDYSRKADFQWISLIRLPDFISAKDVDWAVAAASAKTKSDYSAVQILRYDEGLCVQCMHIGPYDNEPETVAKMQLFAEEGGFLMDLSDERYHHEIYISDPRKVKADKMKTIIRHPIRRA